jgi:gamma-glutamyl:cysteine ligase YbdK (ATP-grasp superfamily)
MGAEIFFSHFRRDDFHRYERALSREMALLHECFQSRRFSEAAPRIGMELELWLIDETGAPQPRNHDLLNSLDNPEVVPELSQFNVEFNVQPQQLTGGAFSLLEDDLAETVRVSNRTAGKLGLQLLAIGTLPTIQPGDLTLQVISHRSRYRALNEQVLRQRQGRPLRIDISGIEQLSLQHRDVMLEAAATSLQMHLQVPASRAARYYNAAVMASAATVAVSANAPLLFGKRLWAESRIPLFEQAVDLGGLYPRVDLGTGYAAQSLEEFFLENRICHPVLLPMQLEEPLEVFPHVRLHNGTIWRWNRPLIGLDEVGIPHLRIEHRVMSAGPSLPDMTANLAFASGLIQTLASQAEPLEQQLPFPCAAENFYQAARDGLSALIRWLDGRQYPIAELIREELLPMAKAGLQQLQIDETDIQRLLQIIEQRVAANQTGSHWQLLFLDRHGPDLHLLTREYQARQLSGEPVHTWSI